MRLLKLEVNITLVIGAKRVLQGVFGAEGRGFGMPLPLKTLDDP
jgi:hypothetical protein